MRSYDYRCGEGGMEIKIEEMTDVLCQTGMCNKNVPLSRYRHREMPEGIVICKSKSNVVKTHVIILNCVAYRCPEKTDVKLK